MASSSSTLGSRRPPFRSQQPIAPPLTATTMSSSPQWRQWFVQRDSLPQTTVPRSEWYTRNWNNGWGPDAITYPPAPTIPESHPSSRVPSIVDIARHYLGLPYRHHHIPGWDPPSSLTGRPNESQGLDCSNYTAWIYNYGRGVRFTSNVHRQAFMYEDAGSSSREEGVPVQMARINRPTLSTLPRFQPGDLLFFWRSLSHITGNVNGASASANTLSNGTGPYQEISHVAMFTEYVDTIPHIIDSHGVGVTEHPLTGPLNSWYENHFSHAIRITLL